MTPRAIIVFKSDLAIFIFPLVLNHTIGNNMTVANPNLKNEEEKAGTSGAENFPATKEPAQKNDTITMIIYAVVFFICYLLPYFENEEHKVCPPLQLSIAIISRRNNQCALLSFLLDQVVWPSSQ